MSVRVAILVYDTCAVLEVALSSLFIRQRHEVITVGLEDQTFTSMEGLLLRPHMLLEDVHPDTIHAFIIPEGQPDAIKGNLILGKKLRSFNDRGMLLVAIGAGPVHLGTAGILNGHRFTSSVYLTRLEDFPGGTFVDDDIVEDSNIITARANAYVDLALLLGKRLEVFNEQPDHDGTSWAFKEFE